jgi:hypothetical protein
MFHFHYPSLTPWMQNCLFLGSLPQNIANYTPCPLRTQRKNAAPLPERKKKMLPAVVAFEALGGVDDAAELCCANDSCRCQLPSETPECRFLSDAKPPTTTSNTSSSNEPKFNTSVP